MKRDYWHNKICLFIFALISLICWLPSNGFADEVEGQLIFCSPLPESKSSDYPDCLFSSLFEVKQIIKGECVKRKIIVVFNGFFNRISAPEAFLVKGDKLRLTIRPFEEMPEAWRSTKMANDIDDFTLDLYGAEKVQKIKRYSSGNFTEPSDSGNTDTGLKEDPPVPPPAAPCKNLYLRKQAIDKTLAQINDLFAQHGGSLETWECELLPVWKELQQVPDQTKWINGSLYASPCPAWRKNNLKKHPEQWGEAAIRGIKGANEYLKSIGVDLIVVPFPDGDDIAADRFLKNPLKDVYVKPRDLWFIQQLLKADVEVINLYPYLMKERHNYPCFYAYVNNDYHPYSPAYQIAAVELSKRLSRYDFSFVEKLEFSLAPRSVALPEQLRKAEWAYEKRIPLKRVLLNREPLPKPTSNKPSPVIFIGDSFMAGFYEFGAYELGFLPAYYGRNGGAYEIFRYLTLNRKGRAMLQGRQVCVFVFDILHAQLKWFNVLGNRMPPEKIVVDLLNAKYWTAPQGRLAWLPRQNLQIESREMGAYAECLINDISHADGIFYSVTTSNTTYEVNLWIDDKLIWSNSSRPGPDSVFVKIPPNSSRAKMLFKINHKKATDRSRIIVFDEFKLLSD